MTNLEIAHSIALELISADLLADEELSNAINIIEQELDLYITHTDLEHGNFD